MAVNDCRRDPQLLYPAVQIPVSYRAEWQDGLGARGWKLDRGIGDPVLLAVTAYTGSKVPTSVLVHDILDHCISGFGLSGHRNEAKATLQLHLRTGAEIVSSYTQLARDIIAGGVNGEALSEFLPPALRFLLPASAKTDRERMNALLHQMGSVALTNALIERLWEFGHQGIPEALRSWSAQGLEPTRRSAIGMCLQHLLELADHHIATHQIDAAQGAFIIGNHECALDFAAQREQTTRFSAQCDVISTAILRQTYPHWTHAPLTSFSRLALLLNISCTHDN